METLVSLKGLWAEGCVKLKSIKVLEQDNNASTVRC
jgi:hypothetical protein